ncbi:MAG TPA: hypothetical protein VEZ17_16695 [Chitinophagaceae bacterium]|jgi:hypothetical protein|nr:hypothetical protein [Chitinophagaceae bacterium]
MQILVFKTNIRYKKHITIVKPHLNRTEGILRWNVDLDDKDKILRIEAGNLHPRVVEAAVQDAGYLCEELKD